MMLFSHKFLSWVIVFLGLTAISPRYLLAIGEEAPIVALANNNIYFVSPSDGEARLIVERNSEKDALLNDMYAGAELELGPMSPDNTRLAYTAPLYEMFDPAYEDKLPQIASLRPRELFLVDMATGKSEPITNQGANFADVVKNDSLTNISNLTWSIDGQRLYFLASEQSLRNRVPQTTIEYYDVTMGEVRVLVKLNSQVQPIGLYAMFTDLLLLDGAQNQGNYTFTQYDSNGEVVNSVDMELTGSMDCTNGVMFDMNPVFDPNIIDYYYGYYLFKEETGEMLPSMLDVSRNNSVSLDEFYFPALISQANPIHSLRLVYYGACRPDVSVPWALTDATGEHINGSDLGDVYSPYQITLSPDGQSVAALNGETIRIIEVNSETTTTETLLMENNTEILIPLLEENGTREIPFSAERIIWGAFDYTFARHIARG